MNVLVKELLKDSTTVVIGSVALGVSTSQSDIDICVPAKNINLDLLWLHKFKHIKTYNGGYSESILMRHSELYSNGDTDIFVFYNYTHLKMLKSIIKVMKKFPKFLLKNKWFRVKLFRLLLTTKGL